MLDQIYSTMNDLILMRGKLLSNMLTDDSMIDLKEEIAGIVDWGNGYVGFITFKSLNYIIILSDLS